MLQESEYTAARTHEAVRKLKLITPLLGSDYSLDLLKEISKQSLVPAKILWTWRQAYLAKQFPGLLPDWKALDPSDYHLACARLEQLGEFAAAEVVTEEDIRILMKRHQWSHRTAVRWLLRYRVGGLWGLAPGANPDGCPRPSKGRSRPLPDVGALTEVDVELIEEKYRILGNLATRDPIADKTVEERAALMGISKRALWGYIHDYRKSGIFGLVEQRRSDRYQYHSISPRMILIIRGLRFSKRNCTVRDALNRACEIARILGEAEPSEWQVRSIFAQIPDPIKHLADGDERTFRDNDRFTHRMIWDITFMVAAIDHVEPMHIYVKDTRRRYRAKSGEIRPYLTLAIDFPTRLVMGFRLSYDKPDRFIVAATLRECFLPSPLKPFVTRPKQVKVDNGKALNAHHVQLLMADLEIDLQTCDPGDAEARGILERMNRTVNTALLATLAGYIDPQARRPHTPATLTMDELEAKLLEFFINYNHTEHTETKRIPYDFWREEYLPDPVDPRKLDLLLMERIPHKVLKEGIKDGNRIYWHQDLNTWVGKWVNIRKAPGYHAPDTVEVYDDDQWICTASAFDSEEGRAVTALEVAEGQRNQRRQGREQIQRGREAVKEADKEIQALPSPPSAPATVSTAATSPTGELAGESPDATTPQTAGEAVASVAPLPSQRPGRAPRPKTPPAPRKSVLEILTQQRLAREGGSKK